MHLCYIDLSSTMLRQIVSRLEDSVSRLGVARKASKTPILNTAFPERGLFPELCKSHHKSDREFKLKTLQMMTITCCPHFDGHGGHFNVEKLQKKRFKNHLQLETISRIVVLQIDLTEMNFSTLSVSNLP